jgi:NitT/TauT family transport system ATP-binding protein
VAGIAVILGTLALIVLVGEGNQVSFVSFKPILDASVLLNLVTQGDVKLTEIGQDFETTTILRSKDLFRHQVLANVPVLNSMIQTLRENRDRSMRAVFFIDLLNEYFSDKESERQFATAIDWGRYAELFEYDASEERLYLVSVPSFSPLDPSHC